MERLLNVKEVAEMLGLKNEKSLYVILHHKRWKLKSYKIGRNLRFKASDVQDFIDSRSVELGGKNE